MTEAVTEDKTAFRRALVVDDEGGLLLLVRAILEHSSYLVDVAHDGVEACEHVKHTVYDVIICDIRMPNMDGPTFYSRLRQINQAQAEKVVFVTGLDLDRETLDRLRESGCPVLHKPFEVTQFAEVVNAIADRRG